MRKISVSYLSIGCSEEQKPEQFRARPEHLGKYIHFALFNMRDLIEHLRNP